MFVTITPSVTIVFYIKVELFLHKNKQVFFHLHSVTEHHIFLLLKRLFYRLDLYENFLEVNRNQWQFEELLTEELPPLGQSNIKPFLKRTREN